MNCYDCGGELVELSEDRNEVGLAGWQHTRPALLCPAYATFRAESKTGERAYRGIKSEEFDASADYWLPQESQTLDGHEVGIWSPKRATERLVRSVLRASQQTKMAAFESPTDGAIIIRLVSREAARCVENCLAHEYLHAVLDSLKENRASTMLDNIAGTLEELTPMGFR